MAIKYSVSQICRHSLILLFSFLFSISLSAQEVFSSQDKKSIKLYKEAQVFYDKHELSQSIILLSESIERDPNFVEAHTLLAYIYLDQIKYNEAKLAFKKALDANPRLIPNNLFFLAELELRDAEYEQATSHFKQFLSSNPRNQDLINRANRGIDIAEFSANAIANPVNFTPVNLGPEINTPYSEYFPCLTVDENTILFTRRLTSPNSPQGFNEDFFVSNRSEGKWSQAQNIGLPINTENNEGAPSLSADGQLLIFTACELYGNYGGGRQGFGSCDLFYTSRAGDKWTKPINLGQTINSGNWETQPSFAANGKTLYFIRGKRSRTGSRTGDIYTSELDQNGYWTKPEMLGPTINTPGNEESVFIHPDGKTLYFSSDGHLGMGGLDIFRSQKMEDGSWSTPINLGYPINSSNNENSLLVSADGESAYFASDRAEGYGELDLYKFELPQHLKPTVVTYFKGKIFDKETKQALSARFELIDLNTGELVVESYSNEINGDFLVSLPTGKDYALNVSKSGYLFYSENFSLSNSSSKEAYYQNVPLKAIKIGEAIVLKNIFFDTGKYDLKTSSLIELKKLVAFLKENSTLEIEVSGHTDAVGNQAANLTLSNNRANTVKTYLTSQGIDSNRITAVGYGSEKPISSNDSEKGRSENRRTEFKILGL